MNIQFQERIAIELDGEIALLRLTRGDRHNAVDMAMLKAGREAVRWLRRQDHLRCVIISGEGPSFCAGIDIKSVLGNRKGAVGLLLRLFSPMRNDFQRWSMLWRDLPMPVIAAIHGNCFGAGIQLALGADLRIATPDARISIMEAKWGLIPDMGGAALLRELMPLDVAKELCWSGRVLDGAQAQALHLVTHVAADPFAKARELAAEIATRSPDAVAAGKFLLQSAWDDDESRALAAERRYQRRIIGRRNQRIATLRNQGKPDTAYAPRSLQR